MRSSNVIRSFALVIALAAGQFSLQVAHAHAALQQSTPAADAVVASPSQIDLVFNETLIPRASRLKLVMKHGSSTMPIENFTTEIVNNGKRMVASFPVPTGDMGSMTLNFDGNIAEGEWSMPGDGSKVSGKRN